MEAVQTTFELDIISTEYQEEVGGASADPGAATRPASVLSVPRGKLHLRMANLGHPVDPKANTASREMLPYLLNMSLMIDQLFVVYLMTCCVGYCN